MKKVILSSVVGLVLVSSSSLGASGNEIAAAAGMGSGMGRNIAMKVMMGELKTKQEIIDAIDKACGIFRKKNDEQLYNVCFNHAIKYFNFDR